MTSEPDPALLRANLDVSGAVDVNADGQAAKVAIVRSGEWSGSPVYGHHIFMLSVSRLWRALRRDRRWVVTVEWTDRRATERAKQVAEAPSRSAAINAAVKIAADLAGRG